ncbi:coatomer subunit epsilon [Anopheles ziemanni]|uniref:coatomer subunit epsilon n=1 Tax=Anopheles coustani TaxID=139045 RepID=UPI0026595205|nr:coatomer subunit epsilon [Anopheles coustani]XP_058179006.1 coatomer subunit epsilon [Anopheles ziemanni]
MSRQNNEVSELIDVENAFYIGNYQTCINECNKISKPSLEKDVYMYRSYIAQNKYRVVLDEIKSSDETPLLALRYLAEYLSNATRKEAVVSIFDEKFQGDINAVDVIWIIAGAIVYINEESYETAMKILAGNFNLECMSLHLHCLLKMYRVDLAKQVFATMQEKDDDATLTQLSQAWLNIQIGGEKLQDAYFIFQDLCDKFSPTLLLLNGQAVCYIGQQKYDDAEQVLRECLNRDPNNYDTLINLLALSQQKDKNSSQFNRYLSQILDDHKNSSLANAYNKRQSEFDRLVLQFGPSNTKPVDEIVA